MDWCFKEESAILLASHATLHERYDKPLKYVLAMTNR
jgi:hypothetical protein